MVYGLNATDKTPMYEMPLTFVLWFWGRGSIFCVGVMGVSVLSLAICPEIILMILYTHDINHSSEQQQNT